MDPWQFSFTGVDPADERRREALCTLGNGYFATRGAAPESRADATHYPGTYVAGCYNRLTSTVAGRPLEHESLVNMPNWLPLTFRIGEGPWFALDAVEPLSHELRLDLERGVLTRLVRFRDAYGRTTRMVQRRFVHLRMPHLAGLETTLVAEDWSGRITFRGGIDGDVTNDGVERYRALEGRHLIGHHMFETTPDVVVLHAETSQSRIRVAEACRSRLLVNSAAVPTGRTLLRQDRAISHELTTELAAGAEVRHEKIVALYTSRDPACSEPVQQCVEDVRNADDFDGLLAAHCLAWRQLWREFRSQLPLRDSARQAVHLHLFHLLQTVSPNTADHDAGIPARGLHGEAYRGHVFWDELFVVPTLTLRMPQLTRSLLLYRYRRLPRARRAARAIGAHGALFPWQSGSDGREESQELHLNPHSGRWIPDDTHLQRHIGIAIAYNVWHYYQTTADMEFLSDVGAEMMLEIARFFAEIAHYERGQDRYVIRGVVGPDEYHTRYPGRRTPGIDNNAYTNVMTAWLCRTAVTTLDELPEQRRAELVESTNLSPREIDRWNHIAQRMFVPFHDGVPSQFEGYERLAELDWRAYRERYGDIRRLDRILEAEGDDVNRYQVSKQADVLMLFYLLSSEELACLLHGLGYDMAPTMIPRTIEYYADRTSHGSTLSAVVHAWVFARARRHRAAEFFDEVLSSDIHDTQRGTTGEGIHLAAMAGSIDLLQRCFTGIEVRDHVLWLNPFWPTGWSGLELPLRFRGHRVTVRITGRTVIVRTADDGRAPPARFGCGDRVVTLGPGETARFALPR